MHFQAGQAVAYTGFRFGIRPTSLQERALKVQGCALPGQTESPWQYFEVSVGSTSRQERDPCRNHGRLVCVFTRIDAAMQEHAAMRRAALEEAAPLSADPVAVEQNWALCGRALVTY